MHLVTTEDLKLEIKRLKRELTESKEVINAIKIGSVDAFAIKKNGKSEVFTLQSLDYAYRILIEKFSEGALSITQEGLIVYSNIYFSKLIGIPHEKIIGSYIIDIISEESREKFKEHFAIAAHGLSKTEIFLSVNNKEIPVYISLTSLKPQLATVGMIVTDLSEKKLNEQLLRKKNLELEYLNKSLDQFASIASHDLQEPLRKIRTFISILSTRFVNDVPADAKKLIDKIKGASERMSLLIKDVLNFSRIVNSENMFVETDLNQILNNTLEDYDLLILEKKACIRIGNLPVVYAIPLQINQLFYNLVGNALKFSKNGVDPILCISSRMLPTEEAATKLNLNSQLSYVEISFKDNGIGFDPQFAEQIFSIFERLNNKQEYSGTGIGLALCQKISVHHQGIIYAVSKENNGAIFYVILPLKQSGTPLSN